MSTPSSITIETTVHAPIAHVWDVWTNPEFIKQWNAASDDWYTPSSTNDLRVGGIFTACMEARDGSAGFDFSGTYTEVVPHQKIAYTLGDDRTVRITFEETAEGVRVTETFDIENENSADMQRAGWQAILDNFKKVTERT